MQALKGVVNYKTNPLTRVFTGVDDLKSPEMKGSGLQGTIDLRPPTGKVGLTADLSGDAKPEAE